MNKFKFNILMAFIFLAGTVLNQELYYLIESGNFSFVRGDKYIITFFIFLIFTFIKNDLLRYISLSFIVFLNLFQMVHIGYFGTPVQASEVYLLFAEVGEVYGSLKEELPLMALPILLTLVPMGLFWFINKKLSSKIKKAPLVGAFFIFYLVYNPTRTYVTGNTWGRQPSSEELGGMNIYLSSSYFLGRILPAKIAGAKEHSARTISLEKVKSFDGDVFLVLGESLTPNHMSLYGYDRPTTPFLEQLKSDPNFYFTKALSSCVSTDIALAFLMNITYGLGAGNIVYSGKQCLNKLAKEAGYKTYFLSSQSQQQLRYIANSICPKYIDTYRSLDDLDPEIEDSNAADDLILLNQFELIDSERNFVILHQRGSHSPYNLRYPKDQAVFPIGDDHTQNRINHYDNSVVQLDIFMNNLIQKIKKRDRPAIVVYVSDHGEGLGEGGNWGHGRLVRTSYEVPVLMYEHKVKRLSKLKRPATHFNISLMLANILGFKSKTDYSNHLKDYTILGNDIDGFAGRVKLEFENGEIKTERLIQEL
ncbi:MAG: hypothetical protein CME64_04115 [Halobacteriovoraceae bacterium]|nr:hypothetical protein [Halobacteriovoraceae bacterium]